jgi:uncharacterized protein YndB with AHSA1/START domain
MNAITVQTIVKASIEKVWEYWNKPEHITKWAFASDEWEAPAAENDLQVGGRFKTVMASKDKKDEHFDFTGIYTALKEHELIEYDMNPSTEVSGQVRRHVKVEFENTPDGVKVTETFDPENENSEEIQRSGWQSILENFKKHVEGGE